MPVEHIQIKQLNIQEAIGPTPSTYLDKKADGYRILVLGQPGSGKSSLIRYICYLKSKLIPVCAAFSGTEGFNDAYKQFVPDLFIYDEYDEDAINNIIKRQKLAKKYIASDTKEGISHFILVPLDDLSYDKKIHKSVTQDKLAKNGRHLAILTLTGLQSPTDVTTSTRQCSDGVFIFNAPLGESRKKIYELFGKGLFPSYKAFEEVMKVCCADYGCIYINNKKNTGEWYERVFWVKVPYDELPEKFKFGSDDMWDFAAQRYDPDHNER